MENTMTTTRIADLPESTDGSNGLPSNHYVPINIHPNPNGTPTGQNMIMPNPQQTSKQFQQPIQAPPQAQYLSEEQQMQLQQLGHQRLPSRDIAQNTTQYAQDEQIKPNYIPRANVSSDYVRDYEDTTEKNMREYEKKKKNQSRIDYLLTEFQTPIFIAILFFVFQMPMVNTMIFKQLSFLSIYNADGNFNFNGLMCKSILF